MVTDYKSLIMLKIGEELISDPTKRGYEGKTVEEIVELLNSPYKIQRIVEDGYPPRIYTILIGIPDAPNFITKDFVNTLIQIRDNQDKLIKPTKPKSGGK